MLEASYPKDLRGAARRLDIEIEPLSPARLFGPLVFGKAHGDPEAETLRIRKRGSGALSWVPLLIACLSRLIARRRMPPATCYHDALCGDLAAA